MKRSWLLSAALLGITATSVNAAQNLVLLAGHIPKQIQNAVNIGRVAADEPIELSLIVSLDQDLLTQKLEELYGRGASESKHFLSSEQFAQKFGLADKRNTLKEFAQANGLIVDPVDNTPESLVVKVL